MGELAVLLECCLPVSFVSFFFSEEMPEVLSANGRLPALPVPAVMCSDKLGVSLYSSVPSILSEGGFAQIAPSVVGWITIDVVDVEPGPFAGHVQPSEPMSFLWSMIDRDDDPEFAVWQYVTVANCSCQAPSLSPFKPAKFSGCRIVAQHLAQTSGGEYVLGSHALPFHRGWSGAADRESACPLRR